MRLSMIWGGRGVRSSNGGREAGSDPTIDGEGESKHKQISSEGLQAPSKHRIRKLPQFSTGHGEALVNEKLFYKYKSSNESAKNQYPRPIATTTFDLEPWAIDSADRN